MNHITNNTHDNLRRSQKTCLDLSNEIP